MLKILSFAALMLFHPVHVTITSIDLVPDTDSLKVFIKLYYDDFLLDYNLFSKEGFTPERNAVFPEERMNKYLNNRVVLTINNKLLEGKLLNHKIVDNEISANLLYRSGKNPRTITVKNLIMTGLYEDQTNMVIIRINDLEEGVKLTSLETERTFRLN